MMPLAPSCWDWDLTTSFADGNILAVIARSSCQRAPSLHFSLTSLPYRTLR